MGNFRSEGEPSVNRTDNSPGSIELHATTPKREAEESNQVVSVDIQGDGPSTDGPPAEILIRVRSVTVDAYGLP